MLGSPSVRSDSRDPMGCSPPGPSVRGILQARILERVAIPFSGHLPNPGVEPVSSALAGGFFTIAPGRRHLGGLDHLNLFSLFKKMFEIWILLGCMRS